METLNLRLQKKVKDYFKEALDESEDGWLLGIFKSTDEKGNHIDWVITLCDPDLANEMSNESGRYLVSGLEAVVWPRQLVNELESRIFIWNDEGIVLK